MRPIMFALFSLGLVHCGERAPDSATSAGAVSSSSPSENDVVDDDVVEPVAEAVAPPVVSCEALAQPCGGWIGCIRVQALLPPSTPPRYEGTLELAGHTYVRDDTCSDGVCNEMCDPATSVCRHGLQEELPIACSEAFPPSRAPFFCELVAGSCVQHDLPPPRLHPRS